MRISLFLTLVLFLSTTAVASSVFVPDDYATIQQGLNAVAAYDTVFVRPGTYTGPGNVDLIFGEDNISVISTLGPDVTILDGERDASQSNRAFIANASSGSNGIVQGFTITDFGNVGAGGAVYYTGNTISFYNCRFIGNSAGGWGGAAYCQGDATLHFTDCYFEGNIATAYASYAGAVGSQDNGTVIATNCRFVSNSSGGYGGALFFAHGGEPVITDCRFESNETIHGGAFGHYAVSGSYTGCTFLRNSCTQKGGVAFIQDRCSTVVTNCTAYDNSGGTASAFFIEERNPANGCPVKFDNVIIAFNQNEPAFAVVGSAATPTISCSDVYGNPEGDWTGYMAAFAGINGNFSDDPLFCDTAAGMLNLDGMSPCLPGNNECGVLIGSSGPGCNEDGAVMDPDPLYALYAFAIEPMVGSCIVTMIGESHGADDIDATSVRLNETIEPLSYSILPSGSPFDMFKIEYPVTELIESYPLLWDTTRQTYTITGVYSDDTPFSFSGTVTAIGHASGDINIDGEINVGDVVYLINYIFRDGAVPGNLRLAEVNCDGEVNVGDGVYLIRYIFRNGPAPGYCN